MFLVWICAVVESKRVRALIGAYVWLFECGWWTLKGDGGMESCGMKELVVIRLLLCVVLWCYDVNPQWLGMN